MKNQNFNTTLFTFLFSSLTFLGFSQTLTYLNDVPFGSAQNFVSTPNGVYYIGSNNVQSNLVEKIYRTNGFTNGNSEVAFNTANSTRLSGLIELNSNAYFIAKNNATSNIEIWKLDVSGAILVDQLNTSISAITKVVPQNGQIYFVATTTTTLNGSNQAIFRTAGTSGSTKLAAYIPTTNVTGAIIELQSIGQNVYLTSAHTSDNSTYYSTLLDELGNQKITKAGYGVYSMGFCGNNFLSFNGDTLFSETVNTARIIIKSNHTVPTQPAFQQGNNIYFIREYNGEGSFWKTDGTTAGTKKLLSDSSILRYNSPAAITDPIVSNGILYFHEKYPGGVWRTWKLNLTDTVLYNFANLVWDGFTFSKIAIGDTLYALSDYSPSAGAYYRVLFKQEKSSYTLLGTFASASTDIFKSILYGYTNGSLILNTSGFTTSPNPKLGLWKLQISAPTIPFDTFLTVKNGVLDTFHNDVNTCFACTATGTSFGWEIYKHTSDKDSVLIKKGIPIYGSDYANVEILSRIKNGNRWILRVNSTFSPATSSTERNYQYFSIDLASKTNAIYLISDYNPDGPSKFTPYSGKSFTTLDSFYFEDQITQIQQGGGSRFFRTDGISLIQIPYIPASIDTTKSDLTISGVVNPNFTSGRYFTSSDWRIGFGNIGLNSTKLPFTTNLYLSKDANFSPDDRLISKYTYSLDLLPNGAVELPSNVFQIPNDVTAGNYFLIFKVDGDDAIIESNEANNLLISPVTISNPNLVAKLSATPALAPDAVLTTGKLINLNYSRATWASGANRTDSFSLKFYFSKDTLFSADDYFIGTFKENFRTDTTLGNAYFNTNLVPASFATGTYYIVFDIDSEQKILESNENDNKSFLRVVWSNGTTSNPCDTDKVAPVFSGCPSNIVQVVTDSTKCATITWIEPTAADNCTTPTVVRTGLASGSCFSPKAISNIVYTATDAKGNKSTCSFNVTVNVVAVAPTNYCVSKATAPWTEWIASVQFTTINNISSKEGYGDFTNLTANVQSGTAYPFTLTNGVSYPGWLNDPSVANLQWRVWIDFNRNNVFDSTELVASGTRLTNTVSIAIPANATPGTTRMRVSLKTIGAPTACEVFDKGEVEDYTVSIGGVYVDPCLSDTTKPVLSNCPVNIVQTVSDSTKCAIALWVAPTATDNCTASPTITQTGLASGSCFTPKAVSNIIYTATDAKGNKSTCAFTVTVNVSAVVATNYCDARGYTPYSEWISNVTFIDIKNTSIKEGYGDFTAQSTQIARGASAPFSITPSFSWAGDPSNTNLQWKVWIDFDGNKVFDANELVATGTKSTTTASIAIPLGAALGKTRMRVVLKTVGGALPCEIFDRGEVEDYSIIINDATFNPCNADSIAPVFTYCPKNIVQVVTDSTKCATVTWTEPTATDNCVSPTLVRTGLASGSCFKAGVNNISYTATDAKNNKSTCSFNVTVNVNSVVATAYCASKGNLPWSEWISGVQFVSISNSSSKEGYGDFTSQVATVKPGTSYPITVTPSFSWAGDPSNATLIWNVWIDYDNNKVFDASELVASGTRTSSTANILIPATAALGTTRMRVSMKTIGAPTACEVFDRGEVEDYSINIISSGINQCVLDTIPPVFTSCPTNITKTYIAPATCIAITWSDPTATDNCSTPTITHVGGPSGTCYSSDYIHTYTATDAAGNKAICTFKISTSQIPATLPDLSTAHIRNVTPTTLPAGGKITFAFDVENTGKITAVGSYKISTFLSKDSLYSADDIEVASVTQSNTIVGETFNIADTAIIPVGTANGIYYLLNYTDRLNAIAEIDKTNNITVFPSTITISNGVVNTSPVTMTLTANPVSYKQYQTVTYRLTVTNTGATLSNVVIAFNRPTLSSSGSTKTASIGTFNDFCPGGIECSQWNIPTLAANSTATLDVPVFILGATGAITASAQFKSSTPTLTVTDATLSINQNLNLISQKSILELFAQSNWDNVQLNWISNAINVDYFEIQRAETNSDFNSIGKVAQTANVKTFSFTDAHLKDGNYFYRIKSTQLDGSEQFSAIQKVDVALQNGLQVFPNPATDELTVALKNNLSELTRVSIFNSLGVLVKNISKDALNGTHFTTDVSDLPSGTYIVRIQSKNKRDIIQRFSIVH